MSQRCFCRSAIFVRCAAMLRLVDLCLYVYCVFSYCVCLLCLCVVCDWLLFVCVGSIVDVAHVTIIHSCTSYSSRAGKFPRRGTRRGHPDPLGYISSVDCLVVYVLLAFVIGFLYWLLLLIFVVFSVCYLAMSALFKCLHFSMCACHPRAVAMLIFSASFQCQRMIPEGTPALCNCLCCY